MQEINEVIHTEVANQILHGFYCYSQRISRKYRAFQIDVTTENKTYGNWFQVRISDLSTSGSF